MPDHISQMAVCMVLIAATLQNVSAFQIAHEIRSSKQQMPTVLSAVPSNGLTEYIGSTVPTDSSKPRWSTDEMIFKPPTEDQLFKTRLNLFRQYPWKKIRGKVILKAKISGSLPLEGASGGGFSFGGSSDLEPVDSLDGLQNLLSYASVDPRVQAVLIEIGSLNCGYAKLQEARRMMSYFRQSGKKIIGYCSGGAEKELYFALGCDEFYIPPDGGLDLRGFSAAATFVRGVFDKIGIEPQVQRIGKYKSFGDTFNRTSISEAQREVISSLLTEASDFWADSVALSLNKTAAEVMKLWADTGIKNPYDYKDLGFVTGIRYLDQVEDMVRASYRKEKKQSSFRKKSENDVAAVTVEVKEEGDYTLENEFINNPRRKSIDSSIKAQEITDIEQSNENNRNTIIEEFNNDRSRADISLSRLSKTVMTSAKAKRMNSTELLEEIDFFSKMNVAFSRNLFYGDKDMKRLEFNTGMSLIGNNNDAGLISLNLNNMTATDNQRVLDTHTALQTSYEQLLNLYTSTYIKEKIEISKKSSVEKRKEQALDGKLYPAGLYLKKMKKGNRILAGLGIQEVRGGARIAVINAVGGIGSGKSGNGVNGKSLGSDTLISQVRQVRFNPAVKAVVIRVDSPGGSALASDLMWREIRALSKEKPVIASMVDVAASGGYYIAMACDEIVAEELTITGSIGVVSSKFNAGELNVKLGVGVDTISKGRYAEVLSTSRGFTEEEDQYFADAARKAYVSFITKAAASRNMSVEALNEVAQGRVWTGRQALSIGLVDHIGGLNKALKVASDMCGLAPSGTQELSSSVRVQTIAEPKSGLPFPFGSSATYTSPIGSDVQAICDDSIACCGLVSSQSLGISPIFGALGLNQLSSFNMAYTSLGAALTKSFQSLTSSRNGMSAGSAGNAIMDFLEEFF